jgi:hypothetical protein
MRRTAVGLATLGLLLAGCGETAPTAEQAARARSAGFDVALVYVTSVDGYARVAGGTGVYGDDGFQEVYASGPDDLRLTVERRTLDAGSCPLLPVPAAEPPRAPVRCTQDADGWARESGDRHEYAVQRGDALVRVSGTADPGVLRDAALAARPATRSELDERLPPGRSGTPVERGDLPENGDGAPIDPTGPGG